MDDDAIRSLLTRLGRAHPSGGTVIERAAILAEGADFDVVMAWISRTAESLRRHLPRHRAPACTAPQRVRERLQDRAPDGSAAR